jgi:chromate transporter
MRMWDICLNMPYMGATAFGGPAMAITLLQEHVVKKRRCVDEGLYKELFGMCQSFPGPTQGLMSVALGTVRAGVLGGVLSLTLYSLFGFTVMTVFGVLSYTFYTAQSGTPDWMAGLPAAATAMIFLAAFKLGKQLVLGNKVKLLLSTLSACGTLLITGDKRINQRYAGIMFPAFLIAGGFVTWADARRPGRQALYFVPKPLDAAHTENLIRKINMSRLQGLGIIALWLTVLVTVIVLRTQNLLNSYGLLFESLFRVGSMIFGGGYVVLPMLLEEHLAPPDQFFQGFALVQALPGPLFNFSAFLGAVYTGWAGAFIGAIALFSPGTMLMLGFFPFWTKLRNNVNYRTFMGGVTSTAIGFIVAACIQLFELAVHNSAQAVVFLSVGSGVAFLDAPIPAAIVLGGVLGFALSPGALNIGQTGY